MRERSHRLASRSRGEQKCPTAHILSGRSFLSSCDAGEPIARANLATLRKNVRGQETPAPPQSMSCSDDAFLRRGESEVFYRPRRGHHRARARRRRQRERRLAAQNARELTQPAVYPGLGVAGPIIRTAPQRCCPSLESRRIGLLSDWPESPRVHDCSSSKCRRSRRGPTWRGAAPHNEDSAVMLSPPSSQNRLCSRLSRAYVLHLCANVSLFCATGNCDVHAAKRGQELGQSSASGLSRIVAYPG